MMEDRLDRIEKKLHSIMEVITEQLAPKTDRHEPLKRFTKKKLRVEDIRNACVEAGCIQAWDWESRKTDNPLLRTDDGIDVIELLKSKIQNHVKLAVIPLVDVDFDSFKKVFVRNVTRKMRGVPFDKQVAFKEADAIRQLVNVAVEAYTSYYDVNKVGLYPWTPFEAACTSVIFDAALTLECLASFGEDENPK